MKCGKKSQGYTIVEVMIFLAVSTLLLASSVAVISGSQSKTQFMTSMYEIQQKIDAISNNVENGYYSSSTNVACSDPGGPTALVINTGPAVDKGTNQQCTFFGKVIQFLDSGTVKIYSVASARQTTVGTRKVDVKDIKQAKPQVIPGSTETFQLRYGVKPSTMQSEISGTFTDIGAVGFFTDFAESSDPSDPSLLDNKALSSNFIGLPGTSLGSDTVSISVMNTITDTLSYNYEDNLNPNGGITICFNSGTSNQFADITIGGGNKKGRTDMRIYPGSCPQ